MQGLGGETTNDQGREQKGRQRREIGEELHDEIIAWFVVASCVQGKKDMGVEILEERDVVEWLAAKDWNGGQSTPECFEFVQKKKESRRKKYIKAVDKRLILKTRQEKGNGNENGRDILG